MAAATLAVSLLMSGLTFWAVNTIQRDAQQVDTRFGQDLGLLLAANVTPLVADNNLTEVARFSSRFFETTSNLRYIIYADPDGKIVFGIPYSEETIQNSLTLERRLDVPKTELANGNGTYVRQHITPSGEVTDVFVALQLQNQNLGVLALGINPNPAAANSSNLTRDVTIAVFISIWVMVILGAVFNALTITQPIKELLLGVKSIAAGNFQQRINLPFGGEVGELINNFNEMATRLETYDAQTIEEMTAEKAKLDTLVSTIADGALLVNTDLTVLVVNPTAKRLLAWENKAILGENLLDILPQEITTQLTQPLNDLASDPATSHANSIDTEKSESTLSTDPPIAPEEFQIAISQPVPRTIRLMFTQVFDQARINLRGIVITIQDITREVELNEAKSQFISNVSHELRTPLFNIKSFIETLSEFGEDLSDVERREFLETANHETDRLSRLVNDVLDLSRLESSKVYQLEAVDLDQLIEQSLRAYQLNAKDKQLHLKRAITDDLPLILGHYDLLLQVMTNLIGNALKFTPAGGEICVRAYPIHHSSVLSDDEAQTELDSVVRVEICDTGIGIDAEDQAAIFDRFYRVENRVHTLEGTGLGLSIVRNIVAKHQSQVHLISEVGVGTTFWFDLQVFQTVQSFVG